MRNVIVTGGSRGLGLGIARRLATEGYRAIVIARKTNAELTAAIGQLEQSATPLTLFHSVRPRQH